MDSRFFAEFDHFNSFGSHSEEKCLRAESTNQPTNPNQPSYCKEKILTKVNQFNEVIYPKACFSGLAWFVMVSCDYGVM